MIDTLLACRQQSEASPILEQLNISPRGYAVLTLHRPSNVDEPAVFSELLAAVERLQRELPVVFPVHPRTGKALAGQTGRRMPNLKLIEPLGYLDFLKLMAHARVVLTDSGGIQEETTVLGVPCLTLRSNTERPVTTEQGTNRLVGMDSGRIVKAALAAISDDRAPGCIPELWDGRAAQRTVDTLLSATRNGADLKRAAVLKVGR
jgi:UDP-N-acetylglucosamine 2-epimerase (non-hydrolysing)